jgi:nuclear pore complex protein Nup93
MTSQLRDQIVSEFRKITRQSKDPYRIIVYNIVGKCDPTKGHSDVPGWSTEDWMWLKLKMISTVNPSSSAQGASGSTSLSLPQLQQQLRTYGPDHFKNPLLYFQVLLMTLQFEYVRFHSPYGHVTCYGRR